MATVDYLYDLELRKNFLDKTSRIQSIVRMKYEKRTDGFWVYQHYGFPFNEGQSRQS